MLKHKKFPGRYPGTDFQFVIRRASPRGVTRLVTKERLPKRSQKDRDADAFFMQCLWLHFGEEPFERGNLDAGRLGWLLGREVVPAEENFNYESYEALLQIDLDVARKSFPGVFKYKGA